MDIKFYPGSEAVYFNTEPPISAKELVPKWYKDIKPDEQLNVKNCIPFLDTLSYGYIQTTWADIYVEKGVDKPKIYCTGLPQLFSIRDNSDIKVNDSFYKIEFVWHRSWSVQLPEGYSGLVTHPLNRLDLPFTTLSGVVDFDQYHHSKFGNIPFYLNKDFEGVIPKGTPIFQIMPIKREDWNSYKEEYDKDSWKEKEDKRTSIETGSYKKLFWQRKSFK